MTVSNAADIVSNTSWTLLPVSIALNIYTIAIYVLWCLQYALWFVVYSSFSDNYLISYLLKTLSNVLDRKVI